MSFKEWLWTPAKWYQFWMPGSGSVGGVLFVSLVVFVPFFIVRAFFR